jgi:stress response protein YsnF
MVEREEAVIARQRHDKNVSVAIDNATILQAKLSVLAFVIRLL